jgi:hypothetical protein
MTSPVLIRSHSNLSATSTRENSTDPNTLRSRLLRAKSVSPTQTTQAPSVSTTNSNASLMIKRNLLPNRMITTQLTNEPYNPHRQRYDHMSPSAKHLFHKTSMNESNHIITNERDDFASFFNGDIIELPPRHSPRTAIKKKKHVSFNENLLKIHLIPAAQSNFFQNSFDENKWDPANSPTSINGVNSLKFNTLNTPILLTSKKPLNSKFFKTIKTLKSAASADIMASDADKRPPVLQMQHKSASMYLPQTQIEPQLETASRSSVNSSTSNQLRLSVKSIEFRSINPSPIKLLTSTTEIKLKNPQMRSENTTSTSSNVSYEPPTNEIIIQPVADMEDPCDYIQTTNGKDNEVQPQPQIRNVNGTVTKKLRSTLRANLNSISSTAMNFNATNGLTEIWKEIDRIKKNQSSMTSRSEQQSDTASTTTSSINPISSYLNPDLVGISKKYDDMHVTSVSATDTHSPSPYVSNTMLIVNNLKSRNLNATQLLADQANTADYKHRTTSGLPFLYENSINNIKLFNFNTQKSNTGLMLKNGTKQ